MNPTKPKVTMELPIQLCRKLEASAAKNERPLEDEIVAILDAEVQQREICAEILAKRNGVW